MTMNVFRATADVLHLLSFVILLVKIRKTKNVIGLSLKMQELYAIVFITRYLDVFSHFSLYLTSMKLIFIGCTLYTVYLIRVQFWHSYDKSIDSLNILYLIGPCAVLSLLFTHEYTPGEVLWTFSIFLEAVTLLPQILVMRRSGEIENITADYVFCVGSYRALYILNWIYRWWYEDGFIHGIVVFCGLVQTALYADFFYEYARSKYYKRPLELPT